MKSLKVVFIGNRPLILKQLLDNQHIKVVKVFSQKGSLIDQSNAFAFDILDKNNPHHLISYLATSDYDICVSAGCPIIFPIDELPAGKVFLNSHPSALPLGRGMHPINECILSKHRKCGATLHFVSNRIDSGDIIEQEIFDITDDLDSSILYGFIFDLEAEVFSRGLSKLIASNLSYKGISQQSLGTYYTRDISDQVVNPATSTSNQILTKVRAFSTRSQGALLPINGKILRVFKAETISNNFLVQRYNEVSPGSVIFSNSDECCLIKSVDGLVNLISWTEEP